MKNNQVLMALVAVVVVGAAAFFAGVKYQEGQRFSGMMGQQFGQFRGQNGPGDDTGSGNRMMFGSGRNGMRQTVGEIISVDSQSVTVKLPDGSTRIALLSKSTSVSKSSEGSVTDLKVGERVAVFGTENTDGSVTAQSVQLNPTFRGMNITVTPQSK